MSSACSEITWLRRLLSELGFPLAKPTSVYANDNSSITITENHIFHERTKHIEVDCHFIQDAFDDSTIDLPHISTNLQNANIFSKDLPRPRRQFLDNKLLLRDSPASKFYFIFSR